MPIERGAPVAEGRPLVLGHRGASEDAPENTLAAFRLAVDQGGDGVELDVWRCRSGEVVVVHDEDARRVAGSPLRVPDATLSELRALDVGAWKGARFRGERIPLLLEVLEALPGAVVNVELKSRGRDLRLGEAAARAITRAGAAGRVIVSAFDFRLVSAFRLAAPEVPVALLFDGDHPWRLRTAVAARLLHAAAVHPARALVTPERVARWHRRGLGVNVWTAEAPADVERLTALGVDAIITDLPGRTRDLVRRLTGR
jgi:glycerophosphoryl diester phosphodiesterase